MLYLIGGRGRLGQALTRRFGGAAQLLRREVYETWSSDGAQSIAQEYFAAHAMPGDVLCVLAGVLDPSLPQAEHERVNFSLPLNALEGALASGLRVVTFGSVMESLMAHPNRYLATKARLAEAVAARAERGEPVMHVRIHTLYGGGAPAPFMFLGQMFAALKAREPFLMSSGRQLREYHHVDDDASALAELLDEFTPGVAELSHGEPLSLHDLAVGVFDALDRRNLLRVGAMPDPPEDNFGTVFRRSSRLQGLKFRPTLPAVAQELRELLAFPARSSIV